MLWMNYKSINFFKSVILILNVLFNMDHGLLRCGAVKCCSWLQMFRKKAHRFDLQATSHIFTAVKNSNVILPYGEYLTMSMYCSNKSLYY
jgi:hypothetical protein